MQVVGRPRQVDQTLLLCRSRLCGASFGCSRLAWTDATQSQVKSRKAAAEAGLESDVVLATQTRCACCVSASFRRLPLDSLSAVAFLGGARSVLSCPLVPVTACPFNSIQFNSYQMPLRNSLPRPSHERTAHQTDHPQTLNRQAGKQASKQTNHTADPCHANSDT